MTLSEYADKRFAIALEMPDGKRMVLKGNSTAPVRTLDGAELRIFLDGQPEGSPAIVLSALAFASPLASGAEFECDFLVELAPAGIPLAG